MTRVYAKILSSLWKSSRRFKSLGNNDQARLFYLYLHTCPHGNNVGCFPLPIGYAVADLGWNEKACLKAIESLSEAGLIAFNEAESIIFIADFISKDPPTNKNHASAMLKSILEIPDSNEKLRCLRDLAQQDHAQELTEIAKAIESLPEAFDNPTPLPTPTPIPTPTPPSGESSADADRAVDHIPIPEISSTKEPPASPPVPACRGDQTANLVDDDLVTSAPAFLKRNGAEDEAFAALWQGWRAHKTPKGSKKRAADEWDRHVRRAGLDPGEVLRQAAAYCLQCAQTDTSTQHIERWIKNHRWEDDNGELPTTSREVETELQRYRMEAAAEAVFGDLS